MLTFGRPFAYRNQDETPGGGGDLSQAPTEDTPDAGTQPESQPASQDTNWEERYKNLQADHTRKAQEAAEYRRLVEGARQGDPQAIEALGLALADQEDDDEDDLDLDPRVAAKLEALEQRLTAQQQQQVEAQQIAQMEAAVETKLDELQVPDDDALRDWLVSRAVALPPTPEGLPDVAAAHAEFEALIAAQKKQWAGTKRTHHVSPVGQAGTQTPDLDSHQGRVDFMLARLQGDQ